MKLRLITAFVGGNLQWVHRSAIVFLSLFVLASSAAEAARKGGGPAGGGQILPVSLGTSSDCSGSYGLGINTGGYYPLQVAGQGGGCLGLQPRAVLWAESTGMIDLGTLGAATGGSAEGISDDGTVVGWLADGAGGLGLAFVRQLAGPMQALPMMPGMIYAIAYGISANGEYIVGSNSTDSEWRAVRWDRSNGTWTQPKSIPSGDAIAVSSSGLVAGSDSDRARVWNGATSKYLPGAATRASSINSAGTVVVGYRWQTCTGRCDKYEVPMVWTFKNGTWIAQELQALDGVDSEALGVGEVNGRTVIVGYGYTKKDGVMRAVAWKADALGNYGAPIRLAALDGRSRSWARAEGVNSSGQVVGTSEGEGRRTFAVIWRLP